LFNAFILLYIRVWFTRVGRSRNSLEKLHSYGGENDRESRAKH